MAKTLQFNFDDMYEDLMEHQENLAEGIDAKAIIKELIDTSFGGSNESQMKAVQLLKGLATSDDPAANAFMKKLDSFTSGMKSEKSESGGTLDESIKSDLDKLGTILGPDSTERDKKLITLTWKVVKGVSAEEIAKRLKTGLAKHGDKIKYIGAQKKGEGVVAHIEMK